MKILIKATNIDLTPSLKTYIDAKLGSVGRFIGRYERKSTAVMRIEVGRTTRHHRKGGVFMAEANLLLPKKTLRAVHTHADLRVAIDRVRDSLHFEVEKFKTGDVDLPRRRSARVQGRALK